MYLSFQVWLFSVSMLNLIRSIKQAIERSARYISNILELQGLCVRSFDPIKKQEFDHEKTTQLSACYFIYPQKWMNQKNTYNHNMLTKYTSIQVPTLKPTQLIEILPSDICPKLLSMVFNGDCLMNSGVSAASRPQGAESVCLGVKYQVAMSENDWLNCKISENHRKSEHTTFSQRFPQSLATFL